MDAIKEERRKVQEKIDNAMSDPEGKASLQAARNKFNELKAQKNALIDQKKVMRAQLDKIKNESDKLVKDQKDARSNMKFSSLQDIEKEIAKLQRKQETTTMTLNEEKKLIKEMDALQASKKYVAELKDKTVAFDSVKEQRKAILQQISAKDKEIDALSKEMDTVMATIKSFNEKDTEKRGQIQDLFKKRDDFRKQIGDVLKQKDALRDAFRKKSDAWYTSQRAIKAQKKMQWEEEKKKRDEEEAAYRAKLEAEEAKKIPYEEEQALCEFLADYLERTYLKKDNGADDKNDTKNDVVEVKDDPFAGMKSLGKKDDEDEYFGKGKGRKKRNRQSKKQDSLAGPFTLSVDTFEQFSLIELSPPTSVAQVENSVKELREKKEWYKQQERGSVKTAQQIRKENEKAAAKSRQNPEPQAQPKNKGKGGNFSLSSEEFAPLGAGGASSSINSSWGQKSASPPAEEQAA